MFSMAQNIGMRFYALLLKNSISIDDAARRIGFSVRDINRFIEGRLILPPSEIDRISKKFDTSLEELISQNTISKCSVPRLEYNKEFSSEEHLCQIIDLLDEYIELKEQI